LKDRRLAVKIKFMALPIILAITVNAHPQAKLDDAKTHLDRGTALFEMGDLDGAIGEYREAIRLKPGYFEAHYNLGDELSRKGDKQGALAQFRMACTGAPDNAVFCEMYRNILAELSPPKIDDTAQIKLKSGQYLKGTVRGMIVQMCGSVPAGKKILSLTRTGEMRGELNDDGPSGLLQAQAIIIRLCNGRSVRTINEQGLATEPDESLFFVLSDLKGPVTATLALNGLRSLWGRTYSVEKRTFISSAFEEGGVVMAFATSAAPLDQRRCNIEGTIKQEEDGPVKSPAKILPTIELRNEKGLQIVPVKEIALREK
jgi:tetratricopeptide (TPR) repeat protein